MKYFIIVTLTIALIQLTNCQYEEDFGDDAGLFGYDEAYDKEDDTPKPIYDLKDATSLFKKFVKDYGKKYKDDEDYKRHFKSFVENLKEINRINGDKEYSSTADINLFSDFTSNERHALLGGSS